MRETRIADFKLEHAQIEDAATVYNFIKGLATYEKMLDDLVGSISELEEYLFNKKQAEVILAYYNDVPVGFCLYFTSFSTFLCRGGMYLEDVYVDENYRNKGFGKEIFYQLALICQERNYGRLEWVCLDWNEPALAFYKHVIGASAQPEWVRFRLDEAGMTALTKKD